MRIHLLVVARVGERDRRSQQEACQEVLDSHGVDGNPRVLSPGKRRKEDAAIEARDGEERFPSGVIKVVYRLVAPRPFHPERNPTVARLWPPSDEAEGTINIRVASSEFTRDPWAVAPTLDHGRRKYRQRYIVPPVASAISPKR